ncbi:MAG: rRNA pseudouridine synthase [Lentisphaeria bacterium]|nr:rRNA pseudouridine synthase [Lentisphaeria bacterium]
MTNSPSFPVIAKYIASCGVASRRAALELVRAGRTAVNGVPVKDPSFRVGNGDEVTVDGRIVTPEPVKYHVMLNKPRGYTCTSADPHAARRAVDLIDLPVRLVSAGRLDKDSEGLIIFSNDGEYVNRLGHPSFDVRKTYHVRLDRELSAGELATLRNGIEEGGEFLHPEAVERIGERFYAFTLNEGRNREIRRMAAFLGAGVKRLVRVSVGRLRLGSLPPGKWRLLTSEEVAASTAPAGTPLPET